MMWFSYVFLSLCMSDFVRSSGRWLPGELQVVVGGSFGRCQVRLLCRRTFGLRIVSVGCIPVGVSTISLLPVPVHLQPLPKPIATLRFRVRVCVEVSLPRHCCGLRR